MGTLLALMTVTAVLLVRRPRHAVTWVLVVYTATAVSVVLDDQERLWTVWASMWAPLLLAFPDGIRTGRLRQVGFWYVVLILTVMGGLLLVPGLYTGDQGPESPAETVMAFVLSSTAPIVIAALIALVRSWARSKGLRRARLAVVLAAAALLGAMFIVSVLAGTWGAAAELPTRVIQTAQEASAAAAFLLLPIAVGISMLLEPPSQVQWVDRMWPWLLAVATGLVIGATVWLAAGSSVLSDHILGDLTAAPAPRGDSAAVSDDEGTQAARFVATVLFSDIVDSTVIAEAQGDAAWSHLLDEHDALVDRDVAQSGGRIIKHTGDGVLAIFDAPGQAVRCAMVLHRSVTGIGLKIRVGLHTGEIERRGHDIGGIAVHIAARVMAQAAPGEVLVSRTVVDLTAGAAIPFEPIGEIDLKGLAGRRELFRALAS